MKNASSLSIFGKAGADGCGAACFVSAATFLSFVSSVSIADCNLSFALSLTIWLNALFTSGRKSSITRCVLRPLYMSLISRRYTLARLLCSSLPRRWSRLFKLLYIRDNSVFQRSFVNIPNFADVVAKYRNSCPAVLAERCHLSLLQTPPCLSRILRQTAIFFNTTPTKIAAMALTFKLNWIEFQQYFTQEDLIMIPSLRQARRLKKKKTPNKTAKLLKIYVLTYRKIEENSRPCDNRTG